MNRKTFLGLLMGAVSSTSLTTEAREWTLDECLQYAKLHNITLAKAGISRQSAAEDTKQSKAGLLPTLQFSTGHNMGYTPWQKSGTATVTDGRVQNSIDRVSYNGQYSLSANWTVWNGNRNRNQIKLNALAETQAELDSVTQARNIEEQIMQLYVQILYSKEAINVNKAMLEAAVANEGRGKQMFEVGQISRADLSGLVAERAQDEYNVVQSESQTLLYTRQMKELLQITSDEPFDLTMPNYTDAMALEAVPSMNSVYDAALENRPELKAAQLAVESAEVQGKIARAGRMPTISMSASVGASTNSLSEERWAEQMKTTMNTRAGVTLSVPIFDGRSTRTSINKAKLQTRQAELEILNRKTTLYSTIENYWIQASNYQKQYVAAKASTESAEESYRLLSEQFALGLKNIVQLQEGKTRLLSAKQSELQAKYMAILNIKMLEYYKQ